MTNEKYIDPAEEAAIMDAAEEYMLFAEIDEIAASLEDLTFPQLEQVRDFVYSLYTEGDDCGGCE